MGQASRVEPPPVGDPDAGRLVEVDGTRLWVLEMGRGRPILLLHGGPGLDHTELRPWLDPLAERFRVVYVDQRGQGRSDRVDPATLTLDRMVADVDPLAAALALDRFAVLGVSFGSFVALQHAVDSGTASHYVLAGCVPSSKWLGRVELELRRFRPIEIRDRIAAAWDMETRVRTEEECRQLWIDQLPFHFREMGESYRRFLEGVGAIRFSPDVLRHFAQNDYGSIDVEGRLRDIERPALVIAGGHDRVCPPEAGYVIAEAAPRGEYVVLQEAGHMMFCEARAAFLRAVEGFFERSAG
jgi:pimeloyl-ACP methyl ester carboxylesterase